MVIGPGTLALKLTEMPSLGWMRRVRMLGWGTSWFLPVLNSWMGGCLKMMETLGDALGEALADAAVEGDAGPAPVVDLEFGGGVGLDVGLGVDAILLAVADGVLAVDLAGGRTDRVPCSQMAIFSMAFQTLSFSTRTAAAWKESGASMATKEKDFHHVVLEDVAEGAGGLVEGPAAFDADALSAGDLDALDVLVVPERLEDAVAEAEDRDVLHGLFAEVVIDAEDLVFLENGVHV